MARDHRRLRVFSDAHSLVLSIYKSTRDFPKDESYGLRAQIRRAAVSIPSNIVEGNARRGTAEYVNFLNIARGSAGELAYLLLLASELGYLDDPVSSRARHACDAVVAQLEALLNAMDGFLKEERQTARSRRP
jgi:four helix bundle protein